MSELKCLPLVEQGLNLDKFRKIISARIIFILSLAAVDMVLLPLKEIYTSIELPVIILLGAMIPVG